MTPKLRSIRTEIDKIDEELVRLLAERMDAIRAIGACKRDDKDAAILDAPRERAVAEAWAKEAEARGVSSYFVGRVLREILNWSRRDQEAALGRAAEATPKRLRIAFQGTSGSYSELTIRKLFQIRCPGEEVTRLGRHTFKDAMAALLEGDADYALLPVENTIAGTINEVYSLLAEHPVTVVDEEAWEVEHVLAGLPGASLEQIRTVRSQAVALQQCHRFLNDLGCVAEAAADT
ncbi:MAG: prephenate dehydratase domain-containing protein, partial [Planctomycetota bacterium]|nr:prephenate dehydratase domain-containing protein [Planctomycetota bacterium]